MGAPFFRSLDAACDGLAQHMALQVTSFLNHPFFARLEHRPIRCGQRQLLHFFRHRHRPPHNGFVLGVHFDHHFRAHRTSLFGGENPTERGFTHLPPSPPENLATPRLNDNDQFTLTLQAAFSHNQVAQEVNERTFRRAANANSERSS